LGFGSLSAALLISVLYLRVTFQVDSTGDECRLSLSHESFDRQSSVTYHGRLILLNTLENFKGLDRKALLLEETNKVWENIQSGEWLLYPERLVPFVFTVYADLKKFHYYYWNCFPALCFPENIKQEVSSFAGDAGKLMSYFNDTNFHAFLLDSKGNCLSLLDLGAIDDATDVKTNQLPTSVGWERNMQGKTIPQFVDMRKQFDPKK
ncbi:hypothetical protein COOONC_06498, partial [Cooperia oncophora]